MIGQYIKNTKCKFKFKFYLLLPLLSMYVYADEIKKNSYIISDGNKLFFKDKKFSITPPWGWSIDKSSSEGGILMLSPNKGKYHNANIQILRFDGSINIKSLDKKNIYNKYIKTYLSSHLQVKNLYLHDPSVLEFKEDIDGLVFYASFSINKQNMMQVYLLISSVNHHFILCFTDVENHFGLQDVDGYFDEAWDSMSSMKPSEKIYKPLSMVAIIIIVLSLVIAIMIFLFFKKKKV